MGHGSAAPMAGGSQPPASPATEDPGPSGLHALHSVCTNPHLYVHIIVLEVKYLKGSCRIGRAVKGAGKAEKRQAHMLRDGPR